LDKLISDWFIGVKFGLSEHFLHSFLGNLTLVNVGADRFEFQGSEKPEVVLLFVLRLTAVKMRPCAQTQQQHRLYFTLACRAGVFYEMNACLTIA